TNIVRNARHHAHPMRQDVTHEEMARDFDAITFTTPERAAEIIHEGVKAGKSRILVGPDAYLFDGLARAMPTRYFSVLQFMERISTRGTS
ncbi:MAG: acetoin dehydrogenase, partial [Solirubrobacteraceae bacterium]